MNIIILSGGSGKRLWPLSNEVRSKQFLKVFRRADGTSESMLQRMYRMIHEVDPDSKVTVATSGKQVSAIRAQLGASAGISVEPCRRDTFPAIALSAAYLHEIQGVDEDEPVIVCPVDPYVEKDFFRMFGKLQDQIRKDEANLALIGVEPTYPSEKYGYIIPASPDSVSFVETFKEKPDAVTAAKHIEQGALWNAGVFAFRLRYVLDIAKKMFGTSEYDSLLRDYEGLTKISFDYAVVESEDRIQVLRFSGAWKDLGTWSTLTEAMSEETAGNAVAAQCESTHIINELQIPLIALGVKNLAIAATPDGILVADKNCSDQLKEFVADQRPMYEKRVWGEYMVLDYRIQSDGNNSLTKHVIIKPGKHISYQRHEHRTEIWTFVDGTGELILDGKISEVGRGSTVTIETGRKHAIRAITELHFIEVQIGDELTEEDIERFDWNWTI